MTVLNVCSLSDTDAHALATALGHIPPTPSFIADFEIARGVSSPEVKERLAREGGGVNPIPPEEYARFIQSEIVKYAKIVKEAGVSAN